MGSEMCIRDSAKSYFTQFNVSLGENEWYAEAVGELEVNSNLLTIPTRQEAGQDGVYRNYYQLDDMESGEFHL